ncbi:MAG: PolC-type DNA polymerase III, partial [Lachnospiraceae bacterium]|nr:PolC-type DNA polymerase III [Lachnospiraceae bacterium]
TGFRQEEGAAQKYKDIKIRRMSTNRSRDTIRLYLEFPALIPKRQIRKLESAIKQNYFSAEGVRVIIIERFSLSERFTPEIVYDSYKDSILEELSGYSRVLFTIFMRARMDFDTEGHLQVSLEDSVVAHRREQELHDILDKIFCERCGQDIRIDISYHKEEGSRHLRESGRKVQNTIAQISSRFEEADGFVEEEMMGVPEKQRNVEDRLAPAAKASGKEAFRSFGVDGAKGGKGRSAKGRTGMKKPRDPNVLYGREFGGTPMPIVDIISDMGEVVVYGEVISIEQREIRGGRIFFGFVITDDTDSIRAKLFLDPDEAEALSAAFKENPFVRLKGVAAEDMRDHDISIGSVRGILRAKSFRTERSDSSEEKRVELHCHTSMSEMDGISDVKDIIACARKWGHKAIAITDHGVVYAFPEADHAVSGEDDIKVIYGTECYLVDDSKPMATRAKDQKLTDSIVVFDLETTGLNARKCRIIEIGAVKFENGQITERFSEFVNPRMPIPLRITELTGITNDMVAGAGFIEEILPRFREFCADSVLVAHNADFDCGVIEAQCRNLKLDWEFSYLDTIPMAKAFLPHLKRFGLERVAKELSVPLENHHRAVDDAECTAHIFEKLSQMAADRGLFTLKDLNEGCAWDAEAIKRERPHHCILLAKNDLGRIHLYRLVSDSHLNYFSRRPKIPKSLLTKYREGLLIGSACSEGELYDAILTGKDDTQIERLVNFYDYLEVQPVGNNAYLLNDDKYGIDSVEDLQEINRRIVELGRQYEKPVAATCDVHFLNPQDEIYRRILQTKSGFKDAEHQPPLYLHTTEEMLDEFSYFDEATARELVIEAPGRIADMCERIHPTRPDKCPPVIEKSDETLRQICYDKAHELYGETLPPLVEERLERELNSIIGNGYAVMYIIAQKLVWKSNEDGYLVGSRGSVGSSFAATMAGITEVNPLPPHYICASCHFVDFDSEEVKAFAGRAGCDMPDKVCPHCGKPLKKEGFDIPFETFLGFKGNKEPDIDLNFSGDYQGTAHRYTEVIFGKGQTFKAGTVSALQDKTAFGYIKSYYEEKGETRRNCEIERLVRGCVGVRRTTGQHPGGIIVLPKGEDIYSFTPIQHPANKETDIITTHFDYHSIDQNLLKLDILGHDDPTMIRKLEDLTGISAKEIPLDDKAVMSLFKNTEALGVTPEQLCDGCEMGTLGIPEFGTDFAMGMLKDAKPTEFSDLVRIAGLAHGTDVWLGNAKDLIASGQATISTAICTRDDIMTYLIGKGMDSEKSFKIMEAVRKGMVAKGKCDSWPQWKQDMKDHDVPDWYIGSCEKIKYMFPKAHAAAYVMMAWRIAWYKVNQPLAYYAAYFSIRTKFDYEKMAQGEDHLNRELAHIRQKEESLKGEKKKLKDSDKSLYMDMRSVQEMYARGLSFLPLDLYESDPKYFKVKDGKLLPPLVSLDGMGEKNAALLSEAARAKAFTSKDDLKNRGKASQKIVEDLDRLGIVSHLPQSDQLSFFDFI